MSKANGVNTAKDVTRRMRARAQRNGLALEINESIEAFKYIAAICEDRIFTIAMGRKKLQHQLLDWHHQAETAIGELEDIKEEIESLELCPAEERRR